MPALPVSRAGLDRRELPPRGREVFVPGERGWPLVQRVHARLLEHTQRRRVRPLQLRPHWQLEQRV